MGWEERSGGHYYYRKQRLGTGTVVSEYVGSGPPAQLIAEQDRIERRERAQERRRAVKDRKRMVAEEKAVREASAAVQLLRDAVLLTSGYHTHKGQWRKRRVYNEGGPDKAMVQVTTTIEGGLQRVVTVPDDVDVAAASELCKRIDKEKPKAADVEAFREMLRKHPALWKVVGDMMEIAKSELLKTTASQKGVQVSIQAGMEAMARELGYEASPLLERMLIDQVG